MSGKEFFFTLAAMAIMFSTSPAWVGLTVIGLTLIYSFWHGSRVKRIIGEAVTSAYEKRKSDFGEDSPLH